MERRAITWIGGMSVEKMGGEGIQKSIEALCQDVSLTGLRKVGEQRRIVQYAVKKRSASKFCK